MPGQSPLIKPGMQFSSTRLSEIFHRAPVGRGAAAGGAPAIYVVSGGQLHAFQTWESFLRAGGHPDLSNVIVYTSLNSFLNLLGEPAAI